MSEHQEDLTPQEVSHEEGAHAGHGHDAHAGGETDDPMATKQLLHVDFFEGAWMRVAAAVVVFFIIAIAIAGFSYGIQPPGQFARITPEDLLDPDNPFSNPGLRELAPGKYEAYIIGQTWNFLPAEIRVPVGSEVTFYLTARDVQHGFKLLDTNINVMVLPGQVSTLKAVFDEPGTHDYICHEYCGYVEGSPIGHHTMYGQIIVEAPAEEAEETAAAIE
ncbi:MAG: cytochrome c oxidase subunit II [Caldilineaceae bacterium]|nr:cytochrome c oxidase subunit II [Caldilineaceae bacterium]